MNEQFVIDCVMEIGENTDKYEMVFVCICNSEYGAMKIGEELIKIDNCDEAIINVFRDNDYYEIFYLKKKQENWGFY